MASANGTTMKTAAAMKKTVAGARHGPFNKNLNSRRRPKSGMVPGGLTGPIKGPDKGNG